MPKKTTTVVAELNVPYHLINNLIRFGKLTPPDKDTSGDYVWTDEDVDRAQRVIAEHRAKRAARSS